MKEATIHMIRREVFELSTVHSKEGLECQQRASGMVYNIINPILESCFDKLVLGSRRLVIDRLEIDLGNFDVKKLEKDLAERLRAMLEKQLRDCLQTARRAKTADGVELNTTGETNSMITSETSSLTTEGTNPITTGNASAKTVTTSQQTNAQLLDVEETFYTLLFWFLQHGRLPWWLEPAQQRAPIKEVFEIITLQEKEKTSFRELLRSSQAARMRVVNHFDTEWIVNFLQYIDIPVLKAKEQWYILLPVIKEFPTLQKVFHQHFWLEALSGTINFTLVIEKTACGYNSTTIALANAILRICKFQSTQKPLWAGYAEQIEKYLAHKMPYDDFRKQPEPFTTLPSIQKPTELEQEGLFISAAGLVILHPFFTELFTSTGLWTANQWQNENSLYRAVQLLSQLAYGETNLPEYQLTFIKILLGIDIEAPLPAQEPLTEAETEICTGLLHAVISHWTALRNTGPAAIQDGFLQRQGKLTQQKKGYHVTVEHLAQDVLLSRLPWGINMIKLPWMPGILHVNWL